MISPKRSRAVIFGCAGLTLSDDERRFFADADPLGFILFARNCDNPEQVSKLVSDLRASVGCDTAPVLIDQEGGRVQRIGPPAWRKRPAQGLFARMAEVEPDAAAEAVFLNARLIAVELKNLGIDVNCLPLLDVPVAGAHDIIGDRAYGPDPALVTTLGRECIRGQLFGGVVPIVKHMPGHGRALVDSHKDLPVVDADAESLRARDFAPFKALNDAPWAMTAHVVYRAFDANAPATQSPTVISNVIRGEIGFDGFLVSDDMNMKALKGRAGDIARDILAAGCDAALHCNGDLSEMRAMIEDVPVLNDDAVRRFEAGRAAVKSPGPVDVDAMQAHLNRMIAPFSA